MHILNVENSVLFGGLTEDFSLGCCLSGISEESFQIGKRGARIYRSSCWEKNQPNKKRKKHVVEHQKITVNHKMHSQVNDLKVFLPMRRCESLTLEIILVLSLGPVSCFTLILNSPQGISSERATATADGRQTSFVYWNGRHISWGHR